MSCYHVRITEKSNPSRGTVKLDLTEEELQVAILTPYKKGQSILIAGKLINPYGIDRVQIHKTDEQSEFFRPMIEERRNGRGIAQLFSSIDEDIATTGEEVTDLFITAPPGSEADIAIAAAPEVRPSGDTREVFVVHGRNDAARDAVFDFLNSLGLHPLEWSEAVLETQNPTASIPEIVEAAFSRAHAVVVLFTPDDEARLHPAFWSDKESIEEPQLTGQARPNVLFEAGMAMARHPERTVLVELGKLRRFSDIEGIHTIRLNDSVARRQEFAQRLQMAGCPANLTGNRWHSVGAFEDAIAILSQAQTEQIIDMPLATAGSPSLSHDAESLLIAAARDNNGILRVQTMGGLTIMTNGITFSEVGNRRSGARWDQAIKELLELDLIESGGGDLFEVTYSGFQLADQLNSEQGQSQQ